MVVGKAGRAADHVRYVAYNVDAPVLDSLRDHARPVPTLASYHPLTQRTAGCHEPCFDAQFWPRFDPADVMRFMVEKLL